MTRKNRTFSDRKRSLYPLVMLVSSVIFLSNISIAKCTEIIDATLDVGKLIEKHDPEIKVSGNVIVGVMSSTANIGLKKDLLAIQPIESDSENDEDRQLCLKVTSRDGIYTSVNQYNMAAISEAIIHLPYESLYPKEVRAFSQTKAGIAMTATFGGCGQSINTGYYVPANLDENSQALTAGSILLYINSFDATDVSWQISQEIPQDCEYIEEGRHTAYDFTCEISIDTIQKNGYPLAITILREVFGREQPSITINIFAKN